MRYEYQLVTVHHVNAHRALQREVDEGWRVHTADLSSHTYRFLLERQVT